MTEKKIGLKYKGKIININARVCNLFLMTKGLMFTKREKARALLLFDFKKPLSMKIHSYFVFSPFLAVWLDDRGNVLEKKIVKPFTLAVSPKKPFNKLIEIPINQRYSQIIRLLDDNTKDLNTIII